jgi:Ca2+-binding EF-hand superfamily protein
MNRSVDFVMNGNPKAKKEAKKPVPVAWRERISPADYESLRETFLIFDEDGSGKIDPVEINKVFEELDLHKRSPFIEHIITALK